MMTTSVPPSFTSLLPRRIDVRCRIIVNHVASNSGLYYLHTLLADYARAQTPLILPVKSPLMKDREDRAVSLLLQEISDSLYSHQRISEVKSVPTASFELSLTMPLLQLPPELHLRIARFLETRDINSWSQANKQLHPLLSRYLYMLDAQGSNAALLWGALCGNVDTVRMCLRMGANVEVMDRGRTPLSLAAEHGHTAVVKLLLETEGVDADSNRADDRTPLSFAAEHDCGEVVKLLLETGRVDVDFKDADLWTPLFWAANSGSEGAVKLLLEIGQANVDSRNYCRDTPLSWAALKGHKGVVKLLLETGPVNVHSESEGLFGWMGLRSAAQEGYKAVQKLLLQSRQANVNLSDAEGWTLPSLVALEGNEEIMKLLLETDRVAADLKVTSFSWAARYGRGAVLRLLSETGQIGLDPNDSTRYMPLSIAAKYGYEAVVNLLLGPRLRSMYADRPQNGANSAQAFGSVQHG